MNLHVIILCLCQFICWMSTPAFANPMRAKQKTLYGSGVKSCALPDIIARGIHARSAGFLFAPPQNHIQGGLQLNKIAADISDADSIVPELIVPLNSDIHRLRAIAGSRPIIHIVLHILPARISLDATSFGKFASYHFSTTDFHNYLFRLKPF